LDQAKRDAQDAAEKKRLLKEREAQESKPKLAKFDPAVEQKFIQADMLKNMKNYTAAIELLWKIIDEDVTDQKSPVNVKALMELALIYQANKQPMLAVTQLMKIVKIEFKYPLAFYYMGICYDDMEIPDKAKWAYDRALPILQELAKSNPQYQKELIFVQDRIKKGFC
jgi:tetratricopeptide (TPR) repeat protein